MTASEVAVDGGLAQPWSRRGSIPAQIRTGKYREQLEGKIASHHGRKQRDWVRHSQALRGRRCARRDHRATREGAKGGRHLHQEKRYDGRGRRVAPGRSGPALCRRERETGSHRHSLRERGRRDNSTARGRYWGPFRPDLRCEREGAVLYGAEGPPLFKDGGSLSWTLQYRTCWGCQGLAPTAASKAALLRNCPAKIFRQWVNLRANRTEASFMLFISKDKLSDFQCRSWW